METTIKSEVAVFKINKISIAIDDKQGVCCSVEYDICIGIACIEVQMGISNVEGLILG